MTGFTINFWDVGPGPRREKVVAGREAGEGRAECVDECREVTCPMSTLFCLAACHFGAIASAKAWSLFCGPSVTSNLSFVFSEDIY